MGVTKRFTEQIIVLEEPAMAGRIRGLAERAGVSVAVVAREIFREGIGEVERRMSRAALERDRAAKAAPAPLRPAKRAKGAAA